MKTAVEKLEMKIVELEKDFAIPHEIYVLCEKAKIEEKQQMLESLLSGTTSNPELRKVFINQFETWYKETFNKK